MGAKVVVFPVLSRLNTFLRGLLSSHGVSVQKSVGLGPLREQAQIRMTRSKRILVSCVVRSPGRYLRVEVVVLPLLSGESSTLQRLAFS